MACIALIASIFALSGQYGSFAKKSNVSKTYVDSIVTSNVQNMVNPLFSNVDEVLSFRDLSVEGEAIDAEFNQMSEDILKTVTTVCIRRDGPVSKRGIVYEYRANKSVYDNLPEDATVNDIISKAVKNSGTNGSSGGEPVRKDSTKAPTNETTFSQKDTTIDGKTYKMYTKTEVSYE